jgi:membrane protein DedA with SNARE-associated domain
VLTGHSTLLLPYAAILLAAIVEGEIAYIAAAALVANGQLNAFGVLAAGTIGAAIGDQAWFYVFRRRLPRWVARYPALERKAAPLLGRVRRHETFMVLLIRFAPGFRVALAAACAWVDVPPLKFSLLNLLSASAWASVLLVVIGWYGPDWLAHYGLGGWKGALLVGVGVLGLLRVLARYERRAMQRPDPAQPSTPTFARNRS